MVFRSPDHKALFRGGGTLGGSRMTCHDAKIAGKEIVEQEQ